MRFLLGLLILALASNLQAQDLNPYKLGTPAPAAVLSSSPIAAPVSSSTQNLSPAMSSAFTSQVLDTQPLPPRTWFRAEYFIGIVRKPELPPLIRSTPAATAGQRVQMGPGDPILYPTEEGSQRIDYNGFSGLRAEAGMWLNDERTRGVEFVGFGFERRSQTSLFTNPVGSPNFLTRFVIDANSRANTSLFADNTTGPVFASGQTKIEPIYNLELNYVTQGYTFLADRTDFLYGFRYFDMRESLRVDFGKTFLTGESFSVTDQFTTTNQFYGANIGVRSHFYPTSRFGAETTFKIAAGSSRQRAIINGSTVLNAPGVPSVVIPDGFLARPSNSGVHSRDFVTFIPELNLRLTYAITPRAKVYLGYDLAYVSAVVRPGSVIDPLVYTGDLLLLNDDARVMGPITNRPAFGFDATDLLIHAFSFGMAVDF